MWKPPVPLLTSDADSTLCDTTLRQKMVDDAKADGTTMDAAFWRAYSLASEGDGPGPAYPLVRAWQDGGLPWAVVSARDESARAVFWDWLQRHELHPRFLILGDERWASNSWPHGKWKADALARINRNQIVDEYSDRLRPPFPYRQFEPVRHTVVTHLDDRADVFAPSAAVGVPTLVTRTPGEIRELAESWTAMTGAERTERGIGL